jgi:hypothetical protein
MESGSLMTAGKGLTEPYPAKNRKAENNKWGLCKIGRRSIDARTREEESITTLAHVACGTKEAKWNEHLA